VYLDLNDASQVAEAIRAMAVRGAPAIGVTAAYGVVLAARHRFRVSHFTWRTALEEDFTLLAAARPTAVNLFWALQKLRDVLEIVTGDDDPTAALLATAQRIHAEDIAANRRMGELGAALFTAEGAALTHCNTGSLATGGYGTALGVIRSAYAAGRIHHVYATETRPWMQGARLTAWELGKDGIPFTLLTDGAAGYLMATERIQWVVVGADRIAANGDVANKIGTYQLAVTARHHRVGFMVVAPSSTVDLSLPEGKLIPIETRAPAEVLTLAGISLAPPGTRAWNPAFDVTPAALVDALVTERGVVHCPTRESVGDMMSRG